MSYEGYTQALCEQGHYVSWGCWDQIPRECPTCLFPITQRNHVDETNGCEVRGELKDGVWVDDPEGHCQCGRKVLIPLTHPIRYKCECGGWHSVVEPTYTFGEVHKVGEKWICECGEEE